MLVTNQPDIARGTVSGQLVSEIHQRLKRFLQLDDVRVCPHDDAEHCDCRKPMPGLLLQAARSLNIDLGSSFVVGDRWRDVEAGQRAGCKAIFVDYGYREQRPAEPFLRVRSLRDAVDWILRTAQVGLTQHA